MRRLIRPNGGPCSVPCRVVVPCHEPAYSILADPERASNDRGHNNRRHWNVGIEMRTGRLSWHVAVILARCRYFGTLPLFRHVDRVHPARGTLRCRILQFTRPKPWGQFTPTAGIATILGSGVPWTCRFESCSRYVSIFEEVRRPAAFSRVGPFGPWLLFWLLFYWEARGAGPAMDRLFHNT